MPNRVYGSRYWVVAIVLGIGAGLLPLLWTIWRALTTDATPRALDYLLPLLRIVFVLWLSVLAFRARHLRTGMRLPWLLLLAGVTLWPLGELMLRGWEGADTVPRMTIHNSFGPVAPFTRKCLVDLKPTSPD